MRNQAAPRPAFPPRCGRATPPSGWRGLLYIRTVQPLKLTQTQLLQPLEVRLGHLSPLPRPCPVPSEDLCTLQVTGQAFQGSLYRRGATRCTILPARRQDQCLSGDSRAAPPHWFGPRPTPQVLLPRLLLILARTILTAVPLLLSTVSVGCKAHLQTRCTTVQLCHTSCT
jgi:hypothetical protein